MNTGTPAVPQPMGPGGAAAANQTAPVKRPPVALTSSTQVASITELRTEVNGLSNPNPLGATNELVDYAMLEAPDGTLLKVRTLYDSGATDSILDWKLASFLHHTQEVEVAAQGINSTATYSTHVGELKIMRADGTHIRVKALKGEMSSSVFTLKKKSIDIPSPLAHLIPRLDLLPTNSVGDVRVTQPVEDYQVQLLLGLDNVA